MDRFSKDKIKNAVKDIVSEAHLGQLNGKDIDVNVYAGGKRIQLAPMIMVFQKFAYLCATEMKPSSNKVLMLFFAVSAYENVVSMDVKTIQEYLGLGKTAVVTALNELEENNIIIKMQYTHDKRRHEYFINPYTAWKGNAQSRKAKLKEINKGNKLQLDMFSGQIKTEKDLYTD